MKVYPKIPRHDHPVVPSALFEADDLVLVEKVDGSSFRFTLFEERYADEYPDVVRDAADGDGSLVFGTRRTIRGCHRDPIETIDGALRRAVRSLREGIDADELRAVHQEYGGPLVVYAENLVYSTLDYGYTEQPLPALVGFDLLPYSAITSMTPPGNPYEETFEGFLGVGATGAVFDRIRVADAPADVAFAPAALVDRSEGRFDPEAYEVPSSALVDDVRAEGVVLRSDTLGVRAKLVREAFREVNREQFGARPDDAESGAEYVVATYCTPGRIRTQVRRMVVEEGREFGLHLNEDLYPRVVEDIWAENWPELMELDVAFNPSECYPLVAKRCIAELRTMRTNAELNAADPTELWRHLS